MKVFQRYISMISGSIIVMLQFIFLNSFSQNLIIDFEGMKGTCYIHRITDKTDSISALEIVELRDEKGIPLWFYRNIFKNVCLTGECKMVRIRIYWNGAGNYLGFKVNEKEPLTKTDHTVFSQGDYRKLDRILMDSISILKDLKLKDLTVEPEDKNKDQVDAHSGATQPSLREYLVKNAAYTCYTLWHTVYGTTRENIQSILELRADKAYLQLLFSMKDTKYLIWAIDFVGRHSEFHMTFYPEIMNQIKSDDTGLSQKALSYFTPARLSDTHVQRELAMVVGEALSHAKFEIIWKFSSLPKISNDAILIMLAQYENQQISVGQVGYVFKLIHPENLKDIRIIKKLKYLSKDKNLFIRNIALKIISERKL